MFLWLLLLLLVVIKLTCDACTDCVCFVDYRTQVRFCFLALSMISFFFVFVTQISPERLNGFVTYSQGRHVWSLAQMSLNVKVKGHHREGQKHSFHSHHSWQRRMERAHRKWHHAAADGTMPSLSGVGWCQWPCVRCVFGKTSLALVFPLFSSVSSKSNVIFRINVS